MSIGENWEEIFVISEKQLVLLSQLIKLNPNYMEPILTNSLFSSTFFLAYLKDDPQANRLIQNQINSLCQANVRLNNKQLLVKNPLVNLITDLIRKNHDLIFF